MTSIASQKAENKSLSIVGSLFRKKEDSSVNKNIVPSKLENTPAFNFGKISFHNSGNNSWVQPKLQINQPGDQYEQEADAMADKVMRMSDKDVAQNSYNTSGTNIQRKCAECEKEDEEKKVQRKENKNSSPSVAPPIVHDVLSSPGKPMDNGTRSFMESRFNYDFRDVRIHNNEKAAASAASINASAYTYGNNIVFNKSKYSLGNEGGKKLLAHELTHVVQQRTNEGRSIQRHPDASSQKTGSQPISSNAALKLSGDNQLQNIADVMTAVQSIKPSDKASGIYTTEFQGRKITLTHDQQALLISTAKKSIKTNLEKAKRNSDYAKNGYEIQKEINDKHKIVSSVVITFAGVQDKIPQLLDEVQKAELSKSAAEVALQSDDFVGAGKQLAECERAAKHALILWREYHEGIISSGEKTITVLEFTRDASFVTLGVLAIIATGGAAAAGTGAVTTTTAFGFEVATVSTANIIATGAPIAATLGGAGMQMALGDKVDWTKVGVDIVVNLILARFGGKISNIIFRRLVGNPAVRNIGAVAFGRIFSSLITHELSTAFITSVDAVYGRLKGQNITWEEFLEILAERLADPKGLVIAGVMGAIQAGADAKLGGAKGVKITDKKGAPTGEIDEVQEGTIREKKSAEGLGKVNPKTGKPFPGSDEVTWAENQIYTKTKTRIGNLKTAVATRPSEKMTEEPAQKAGSQDVPTIKELQGVRKYEFRIDADTPDLRAQVGIQIKRLQQEFPDWTFSAVFGK
ncbi:DUF4157 domain-containing protein [Hanamia caeni]|uniref:DUF4157 domain-containing protein n=1 Tax=Hanamia caeni TaxID=2294116 RepID=A0A3M9NQS4_9BACT|nr:DUF4157 domain-containing protein [Hanamia caeni]RNI39835.1 DUF4157 domain-containing protein [Hanamia caeni]